MRYRFRPSSLAMHLGGHGLAGAAVAGEQGADAEAAVHFARESPSRRRPCCGARPARQSGAAAFFSVGQHEVVPASPSARSAARAHPARACAAQQMSQSLARQASRSAVGSRCGRAAAIARMVGRFRLNWAASRAGDLARRPERLGPRGCCSGVVGLATSKPTDCGRGPARFTRAEEDDVRRRAQEKALKAAERPRSPRPAFAASRYSASGSSALSRCHRRASVSSRRRRRQQFRAAGGRDCSRVARRRVCATSCLLADPHRAVGTTGGAPAASASARTIVPRRVLRWREPRTRSPRSSGVMSGARRSSRYSAP